MCVVTSTYLLPTKQYCLSVCQSASQPAFAVQGSALPNSFGQLLPLGTVLALKVCAPACVRLDSSPQQPHTFTHTPILSHSLTHTQHQHNPSLLCSKSSLYSRLPSFPSPRLHPQAGTKHPSNQATNQTPKSHWKQYKQPSPARHSGTFYARPPRPLLRNYLNHRAQSLNQYLYAVHCLFHTSEKE